MEPGFVKSLWTTGNKDHFDTVHNKHMNGLAYSACVFFKGWFDINMLSGLVWICALLDNVGVGMGYIMKLILLVSISWVAGSWKTYKIWHFFQTFPPNKSL